MSIRLRRLVRLLAVSTVIVTVVTACGGASGSSPSVEGSGQTDSAITVAHTMGSTTLPAPAQRVVALEFSFVDALLSLGVTPVGIADDQSQQRITELAGREIQYTSVGDRKEPNLEIIAQLNPDLIIADTDRHSKIYSELSQIAPTIVLNSREGSYQEIKDGVRTISQALGDPALGEKVVSEHEAKMAGLAQDAAGRAAGRTVQLVTARDQLLRFHTSSSFVGGVMEALNLQVAVQANDPYEDASLERLAAVDPGVLFIAADSANPITKQWAESNNPLWTNLTSVSSNKVVEVNRNLFTRFRGLESAERMAQEILAGVSQ